MPKLSPESVARYPLSRILGSQANVRTLRALCRHGGQLSATQILWHVELTKGGLRNALIDLEKLKIVDRRGAARSQLYQIERRHPLAGPIFALFEAELHRFEDMKRAIRDAAQHLRDTPLAVWIYGSTARGEDTESSDLDIAVVASKPSDALLPDMQSALRDAADRLAYTPSFVVVEVDDILRYHYDKDVWWASVEKDDSKVIGTNPAELRRKLQVEQKALIR